MEERDQRDHKCPEAKNRKSLDFLTHTASPVMRSASNLHAWRMPKGGSLKLKKNAIVHTLL
ncbi:hypothetical protein ISN44_As06g029500 [Arabidopsis suecica]|uniref:Uncharacterized protein n=1 Tax=Arabidopsis suecica TaxID=45249 RepID=A0A8T2CGT3_ARASU|nr:hypothetical protein ISN44_As06g029500 [Arabidopsis suecica]